MGPQVSLVGQIVSNASRDLHRFYDLDDPNRVAAGEAALREIDAAVCLLREAQRDLVAVLSGTRRSEPTDVVAVGVWRQPHADARRTCLL